MRILFASMPADGHFNPLTGIAVHLAARGHDVRWYAGPLYGGKLDALAMPYFPYRRATEVTAGNLNDLFPERAGLRGPKLISFDLEKFFVATWTSTSRTSWTSGPSSPSTCSSATEPCTPRSSSPTSSAYRCSRSASAW